MNDQLFLKIAFLTISLTVLSGCAEMNSKFDCPMKPGVRCESIDKVNARVDNGEFRSLDENSFSVIHPSATSEAIPSYATRNDKDKVMHIWIAPYMDKEGNYHSGNSVYSTQKLSDESDE